MHPQHSKENVPLYTYVYLHSPYLCGLSIVKMPRTRKSEDKKCKNGEGKTKRTNENATTSFKLDVNETSRTN